MPFDYSDTKQLRRPVADPSLVLTDEMRRLAAEFVIDKNATHAAARAGFDPKTGARRAYTLLANPLVKAEIARLEDAAMKAVQERVNVSLERVLRQASYGAFFDVRKLFNDDGSPKAMSELDAETASAIEGVEVLEKWEGIGEERRFVGNVVRYKLAKRQGYVDMLMKHLGAYKKDNEQPGEGMVNALAMLVAQMKGSALPVVRSVPADVIDMEEGED